MSTVSELIIPRYEKEPRTGEVSKEVVSRMAKDLGADSVEYQTIQGLVRSIGKPSKDLCMACITGEYPTPMGKKLYRKAWDNYKRGVKERTYAC